MDVRGECCFGVAVMDVRGECCFEVLIPVMEARGEGLLGDMAPCVLAGDSTPVDGVRT